MCRFKSCHPYHLYVTKKITCQKSPIFRTFLRIWTLKFHSQNRGSPKAFFECFWDLNGRFFIFKRTQSRFGRKIPKSALFYCEKLSQSFRRFLVRYAESVESHYSRLVRHFYFPDTINKESEMMPMKKITFNAPLNHKAYSYEPMKIEVEKVILKLSITLDTLTARIMKLSSDSQS